jgi:hypothetical protein
VFAVGVLDRDFLLAMDVLKCLRGVSLINVLDAWDIARE